MIHKGFIEVDLKNDSIDIMNYAINININSIVRYYTYSLERSGYDSYEELEANLIKITYKDS